MTSLNRDETDEVYLVVCETIARLQTYNDPERPAITARLRTLLRIAEKAKAAIDSR